MDPGVIRKDYKEIKTMIVDQTLPLLGTYQKNRLYKSVHSNFIYYNLKLKQRRSTNRSRTFKKNLWETLAG